MSVIHLAKAETLPKSVFACISAREGLFYLCECPARAFFVKTTIRKFAPSSQLCPLFLMQEFGSAKKSSFLERERDRVLSLE